MAESARYSKKDFMRGLLVLETTAEMTGDLDANNIPNILKAELAGVGILVSISATASVIKSGIRWEIQNGAKKLLIHKDKEFHALPTFRVYKEDFTLETDLLPGTEIVGTCFYKESPFGELGDPYKEIFPPLMTGVVFKRCNLDNVYMPLGNTITDADGVLSSHRRIRVQNDLEDWIVDASGNPVEPVNIEAFQNLGLSTDPKDIPVSPVDEPITGVTP